jgi:AcrR family transcriptional regulator
MSYGLAHERDTPTGRQRPSGAFGPARDVARDSSIIEAVLDLIVESGYADLTMSAAAARAKVAKATVHRRWAWREDLVADALEGLLLPSAPAGAATAGTLRDDLIATLTGSSACLEPRGRHTKPLVETGCVTKEPIYQGLRHLSAQRLGPKALVGKG